MQPVWQSWESAVMSGEPVGPQAGLWVCVTELPLPKQAW